MSLSETRSYIFQDQQAKATKRWTWSWVGLSLALGLHVFDEAANDFLSFWNPLVESLRQDVRIVPMPTFDFSVWLGGLIAAVVLLLSLKYFVRRGAAWMRPVSIALSVIMLGNGLLHILATIYVGESVPGVYSSPILLIAAALLLVSTIQQRAVEREAVRHADRTSSP